MRLYFATLCVLIACGEVNGGVDAPTGIKGEVIVGQNNANEVTGGLACATTATPKLVREQSFYRAFTLADYDIRGPYNIKKIRVGFYSATAGAPATTQPFDISIYDYAGTVGGQTIELAKMVKLGTTVQFNLQNIAAPSSGTVDMPVEIPAGTAALAVELHIKDGTAAMHQLLIGTNTRGEAKPGYQRAPGCNFPAPVTLANAGFPNASLVLSIIGDAL